MVMHNEGLFPVMSCLMLVGNGLSVSVRVRAQSQSFVPTPHIPITFLSLNTPHL